MEEEKTAIRNDASEVAPRGEYGADVKFLAGDRSLENLVFELRLRGCKSPMLVCDDMCYRLGNKKELLRSFDGGNLDVACIDKKTGDLATRSDAERIVRRYLSAGCDSLIALGRKSAVQTAKCAKIMLCDGISDLGYYEDHGVGQYAVREVPLLVVPTNFGSGSECIDRARVYDVDRNKVYRFHTGFASTQVVAIDPRMTDIVPPKAIASFGLHALAMSVEAYLFSDTVFCRPYAESAIQLIADNLIESIVHNADKNYRTNLTVAMVLASCAYNALDCPLLSDLTDVISDRYRVNYSNIYSVLFRRYLGMHACDPERLSQILLPLAGTHEYAMCASAGRAAKAEEIIAQWYERVSEKVDYNDKLSELTVEKAHFAAIAEQTIALRGDCDDPEATYSFIVELLEKSF